MDLRKIAAKIEYAALNPFLKSADIENICDFAKKAGLNAVCVLPTYVAYARDLLKMTNCKLICAVGYPFGCNTTRAKLTEALTAAKDGADELELMMNHAALFDNDEYFIANEIYALHNKTQLPVRLMLESSVMDFEQLDKCAKLAWDNGADMLVLNSGLFDDIDAELIARLRNSCKKSMQLKAFGGINNSLQCETLFTNGADFIASTDAESVLREFYLRGK